MFKKYAYNCGKKKYLYYNFVRIKTVFRHIFGGRFLGDLTPPPPTTNTIYVFASGINDLCKYKTIER